MKGLRALAVLALTPLLLTAEDAAAEFAKRWKKLEQDEGLGRVALAKHCENAKMWKEAVDEWSRVMEVFPDNAEGKEHLTKAQERADVVVSRPTDADAAKYVQGVAALRKATAKKYRDLGGWAKSKGLESEAEDAIAVAEDLEATKKVSSDPKQRAVDALNRARRRCKLKPAALDEKLTDGAQKHADYLVKNDSHPSTKGLGAHNEDASLPGYTEDGERAGHQSDIGMAAPPEAMMGMLGTFYHRIPLLHPDLRGVGIGFTKFGGERGGWGGGRCVIDYSGVAAEKDGKSPRIVAYPANKATNVQRAFDNEEPDPLPSGASPEAGMPITLTFFDEPEVKDAALEVRAGGVALKGYFSCPDKPARADFPNEHSLCFIPEHPLDANTVYKAKATATVNGEAFVMEWEFTTGQKMTEGRGW